MRLCRCRQRVWFWRSQEDRRSRVRSHQRHLQMLDYQRSNARIVFFDPHHRGRSSCTCLWRRSWGLGWGSNGSRWPSCLSRRRWNLVPLGFLPHSLWFPCTASLRWSVCWHAGPTSKDNKNSWERRITALKCDEISRKTLRKGTLFCIFITFCIKYVKCFIAASLVLLCGVVGPAVHMGTPVTWESAVY